MYTYVRIRYIQCMYVPTDKLLRKNDVGADFDSGRIPWRRVSSFFVSRNSFPPSCLPDKKATFRKEACEKNLPASPLLLLVTISTWTGLKKLLPWRRRSNPLHSQICLHREKPFNCHVNVEKMMMAALTGRDSSSCLYVYRRVQETSKAAIFVRG